MAKKYNTKRPASAKELAKRFGCCEKTIRNYWAQDREDYLKNAYTRTKPWEYFGYSQRTWYYRGKPMPPELAQTEGQPKES